MECEELRELRTSLLQRLMALLQDCHRRASYKAEFSGKKAQQQRVKRRKELAQWNSSFPG